MVFSCAIIIAASDQYLRDSKFKDCANPLLLPYLLRCKLWLADKRLPGWAAVLDAPNSETKGNPLLDVKEFAWSLGFKIKYCLLRGMEGGDELTSQSLGLIGCMDNIIIYLYGKGEDNGSLMQSWRLHDSPPWYEVSSIGDGLKKRYQRALSSMTLVVRGFVRVIYAQGKQRLSISSTKVRAKAGNSEGLGDDIDLSSEALGWDILQNHQVWNKWKDETGLQPSA